MRADFVTEVARQNGIGQVDLIEKDLILHQNYELRKNVLYLL